MSDCPPITPQLDEQVSPPAIVPPPPGRTRLITSAGEPRATYTANRECDAVTALKRALREYLEQVYIDVLGARIRFVKVMEVWAETDDVAEFPGIAIMAKDEAEYDASGFTPSLNVTPVIAVPGSPSGQKTYLVKYSEVMAPLVIELHTTSPQERVDCSMLLEDALNPVDWMYGFKLQCPHYFNQIATFEPMKAQQLDTEDNARRRWRPGTVFLTGHISVVRARSLPGLQPMATVDTSDGSDGSSFP